MLHALEILEVTTYQLLSFRLYKNTFSILLVFIPPSFELVCLHKTLETLDQFIYNHISLLKNTEKRKKLSIYSKNKKKWTSRQQPTFTQERSKNPKSSSIEDLQEKIESLKSLNSLPLKETVGVKIRLIVFTSVMRFWKWRSQSLVMRRDIGRLNSEVTFLMINLQIWILRGACLTYIFSTNQFTMKWTG